MPYVRYHILIPSLQVTNRRVNALENVTIPRLEECVAYINRSNLFFGLGLGLVYLFDPYPSACTIVIERERWLKACFISVYTTAAARIGRVESS